MKRIIILGLAIILCQIVLAQDSMVRGGFIEYTYLGNKRYEAKLSLYVSCPYPDISPYIGCKVGSDTLRGDSLIFVQEDDITGIPANCSVQSKCSGDTNAMYGVMRLTWTRKFDLDTFSHCNVLFFAYGPKREVGITTGSAGQTFYIDSWLNQCTALGISCPSVAAGNQNGILIRNQDYVLNYGTAGLGDFDSVSYAMTEGKISPGTSINYSGGYSPARPICYLGFSPCWGFPCQNLNWPAGFHLDPLTGQIMFRPTGLCFGPLVVEISLWKNDGTGMQVASKLYRELSVQIVPSNANRAPTINPPYSIQACVGEQSCFNITTDDYDLADSVFLNIESDIPGLTYQINHNQSRYASAQVCWIPDSSFVSNIPYTFTATARDNYCDLPGSGVRAFSIFVREAPNAQTSIKFGDCGRVILSASPAKNYNGMSMQWKVFDTFGNQVAMSTKTTDTLLMKPGKYKTEFLIRTSIPCIETYYDSFEIAGYNSVEIVTDSLFCLGDTIHVHAVNSENHLFEYAWKHSLNGFADTISSEQVNYLADSSHYLVLTVSWDEYCRVSDSLLIHVWQPKREIPAIAPSFCAGDSAVVSVTTQDSNYTYLWNTGDTTGSTTVNQAGWYFLSTTYFKGCVQTDSIEVLPNLLPEIILLVPDSICPGDTATVLADVVGALPLDFLWQDSSTNISIGSTGGLTVLWVTDDNGCRNSDSINVALYPLPRLDTSHFTVCTGQGFHLFSKDSSDLNVYYSFGDTGNYVIPENEGTAEATVITKEGCRVVFPIEIVINELPDAGFSYSVLTERNLLFIPVNQWNAYYNWDFGDGTKSSQMIVNHTFDSNGPHSVRLSVTDRNSGCSDSSMQWLSFHVGIPATTKQDIEVFPNPCQGQLHIFSPVSGMCRIYSSLGSLVWEGVIAASVASDINSSEWKPGMYFLLIETEAGNHTEKIIRH